MTRARISPRCEGDCRQGRKDCECKPYTGPERRVRFDHRLLLVVIVAVYLPLLLWWLWATVERAS